MPRAAGNEVKPVWKHLRPSKRAERAVLSATVDIYVHVVSRDL